MLSIQGPYKLLRNNHRSECYKSSPRFWIFDCDHATHTALRVLQNVQRQNEVLPHGATEGIKIGPTESSLVQLQDGPVENEAEVIQRTLLIKVGTFDRASLEFSNHPLQLY